MSGEQNVVPLFVTYEQLVRHEAEVLADFDAELAEAKKMLDLTAAALRNDGDELAKLGGADQELAKATAGQLLQECRARSRFASDNGHMLALAKGAAQTMALTAVRNALLKRNQRLFGLDNLAKRSGRHAAAMARRNAGN